MLMNFVYKHFKHWENVDFHFLVLIFAVLFTIDPNHLTNRILEFLKNMMKISLIWLVYFTYWLLIRTTVCLTKSLH